MVRLPRTRRPGDAAEGDLAAGKPARRRLSPHGLGRGAGYGLLTAALVVFSASVLSSFSKIKQNQEAALATTGVSLWLAFQADYELQRLLGAIDRYALDPAGPVDRDELVERFDIFWSRLPLLVLGTDSAVIKRVGGADALVPGLLAELRAMEPGLTALQPGDREGYARLRRRLARFQEPLRRLALEVDQTLGREHTALHHRARALYSGHVVYLLGILGSASVFIFLLVRETMTARRLLAMATAARARVAHLAQHDPLTDLPNRVLFDDRLGQALVQARRSGRRVAVHYLDLDGFKEVNDTLGHAAGDAALVAAARRMLGCVREADTLARLGGDEFAVVQADLADADGAATLARRLAGALREPLALDGGQGEVAVGASVGVALFPDDGDDAAQLLRNADLALYRAKAEGRGAFRFFSADMNRRVQARRELERDLRRALADGALELHYQPRFRLADRRLVGMEALVRWRHPVHGAVAPAEFIPLAEESGLIVPLGAWVLGAACRQNRTWQDAGFGPVRVAVNLSPAQFAAQDVVGAVHRALDESGLAARHLELEITEGMLLHNPGRALATLGRLRGLGVHLSLDDFGTGYASLGHLLRFRFDSLKIDRGFVHDLDGGGEGESILRAVVALARTLKMSIVAEGVETAGQLARLEAMGCDDGQGYHLGAPEPPASFEARLPRGPRLATA